MPPKMKFSTQMWHPSSQSRFLRVRCRLLIIYTQSMTMVPSASRSLCVISRSGALCAPPDPGFLVQHPPGDDQYGYEDSGERWLPIHTVESIVSTLASKSQPISDSRHSSLASFPSSPLIRQTRTVPRTWTPPSRFARIWPGTRRRFGGSCARAPRRRLTESLVFCPCFLLAYPLLPLVQR
jgi:hypothetical protein